MRDVEARERGDQFTPLPDVDKRSSFPALGSVGRSVSIPDLVFFSDDSTHVVIHHAPVIQVEPAPSAKSSNSKEFLSDDILQNPIPLPDSAPPPPKENVMNVDKTAEDVVTPVQSSPALVLPLAADVHAMLRIIPLIASYLPTAPIVISVPAEKEAEAVVVAAVDPSDNLTEKPVLSPLDVSVFSSPAMSSRARSRTSTAGDGDSVGARTPVFHPAVVTEPLKSSEKSAKRLIINLL